MFTDEIYSFSGGIWIVNEYALKIQILAFEQLSGMNYGVFNENKSERLYLIRCGSTWSSY